MTIEESRRYIEQRMHWSILNHTVIEEETCTWVAEVVTTHLEKNESFFLLVQGYSHFVIERRWRHRVAAWFVNHL